MSLACFIVRAPLSLAVCAALLTPGAAAAQVEVEDRAVNVAVNAGLGGAVTWARAAIAGRPSPRAFARGAAGGALIATGKQVVASRGAGTAYLGRHVSLVGIGIANSAVNDTFVYPIPIGPITLSWTPVARRLRARVNVLETATLAHYATAARTRFDVESTLRLGVPVFTRWGDIDGQQSDGFQDAHVIILSTRSQELALTRRHEMIHVLQEDELVYLAADPLESLALSRITRGRPALGYLQPGIAGYLLAVLVNEPAYCENPLELEAFTLTEGSDWRERYTCD